MKKAKKKLLYFGVPAVIIVALVIFFSASKPKAEYTTASVSVGPLVQTVSETGTVKPIKEISLNFLSVGRISSVDVKVGDSVAANQVLASLDDSSLVLRRIEAEASLNIAEASLSKIKAGASTETIAVSKRSLDQALSAKKSVEADLEKTQKTILENIRQAEKTYSDLISTAADTPTSYEQAVLSAKTALDNAKKTYQKGIDNARSSLLLTISDKILTVKVAMDNVYKILDDDDAKNVLGVMDSSLKSKVENGRLQIMEDLPGLESLVAKAKSTLHESDILAASAALDKVLDKSSVVLDNSYSMLEKSITSSDFSQSELDAYKTLIISQNTQISAASSALESATQAYKNSMVSYDTGVSAAESSLSQAEVSLDNAIINARNNLNNIKLSSESQNLAAKSKLESAAKAADLAQAQYNSTVAPARSQDLQLAEAQVSQAKAALDNIDKQINDSKLEAPLAGVITEVNYEAGEQFSGGGAAPMIKMLVDNSFDVEVDIAEANISKVKVGNQVDITLDAFPDDFVIKGFVSFIEPAQTVISGVVYYKVVIEFSDIAALQEELKTRGLSLKAGMTANPVITTASRENVISVPSRAIIEEDGVKKVRLLVGENMQSVPVETGLRGDNGLTEIMSGISASDTVITFVKENKK